VQFGVRVAHLVDFLSNPVAVLERVISTLERNVCLRRHDSSNVTSSRSATRRSTDREVRQGIEVLLQVLSIDEGDWVFVVNAPLFEQLAARIIEPHGCLSVELLDIDNSSPTPRLCNHEQSMQIKRLLSDTMRLICTTSTGGCGGGDATEHESRVRSMRVARAPLMPTLIGVVLGFPVVFVIGDAINRLVEELDGQSGEQGTEARSIEHCLSMVPLQVHSVSLESKWCAACPSSIDDERNTG